MSTNLPQSSTKRLFFTILALWLGCVVVYVLMFIYTNRLSAEVATLESDLQTQLSRGERLTSMQQLVNETTDARQDLESYFAAADGEADFITRIEEMADTAGVTLEIANVNVETVDTTYLEDLLLTLQVRGEWSEVFHYVRLLEMMPLHVGFDRLSLEQSAVSPSSNRPGNDEENTQINVAGEWAATVRLRAKKIAGQPAAEQGSEE